MIAKKVTTILLLLGLTNLSLQDESPPVVETSLGSISGFYKISRNGRKYQAFEGIPYAEAPVGKLRFKDPVPVKSWEGTLPATKPGSMCTQFLQSQQAVNGERVIGCEDCLFLNVYVPDKYNNGSLPVMFFIHGGAFQVGRGNDVNETLFMDKDMVLVTINYRLGPFGFLSSQDSAIPGNAGLKDQSVALHWVHDHIKNFGGNPEQVTLFGLSAGSVSVHYHYLTKWSAGLFQRGLSASGVALDPWAQIQNAAENAKKLGALMGCPNTDSNQMLNCLQTRHTHVIANAVGAFMVWLSDPGIPFGPVVEKGGPNPFISEPPINIILKGEVADVPWITGVVSEEGLVIAAEFVNNDEYLKQLNDNWDIISPYLLYFDTIPKNRQKNVAEEIRKHYLGSKEINKDTVQPVIHMISDRLFGVGFEKSVKLQAKVNKSPIWTYRYSYRASRSLSDPEVGIDNNFGVSHGDDIYLVTNSIFLTITKPEDVAMREFLLEFYTSFVIHGVPNVGKAKWEPLKRDDKSLKYLQISDPKNVSMNCSKNFAEEKFWDSLYLKENKVCTKKLGKKVKKAKD